jgi:2-methylaconitate isomerase
VLRAIDAQRRQTATPDDHPQDREEDMSFLHHDRNLEQMLIPITLIRGGTSRGFYFEGKNVPPQGKGLEEFLLAVRGSPDPMGMDGLGGSTFLQSKVAIVSPSSRPDADVDYTFVQLWPDQPAGVTYKMNCGNISAGVPVFALMKNMIPKVPDGKLTVRAFSTNIGKMMYMTLDVLNGEARVAGTTTVAGIPGTGAEILIDFRDLSGGFTGKLFPTGNFVDTLAMDDGSSVEVSIVDLANLCVFFDPASFGIGYTGLELASADGTVIAPPGMEQRLQELRLKAVKLIGWKQYNQQTIRQAAVPFAVSVAPPADYTDMNGEKVHAKDIDLVARFYIESIMHTAAPGTGSCCLAAATAIPGTVPNRVLAAGDLKTGKGGTFTFGHPSGTFSLIPKPVVATSPNSVTFKELAFSRTARIICDGTVYIKNERPPEYSAWKAVDEITAGSFFLDADSVSIQK